MLRGIYMSSTRQNIRMKLVIGIMTFLFYKQAMIKAHNYNTRAQGDFSEKRIIISPIADLRAEPKDAPAGIVGPALSTQVGCQETQLLFGERIYTKSVESEPDWLYVRAFEQQIYDKNGWHGYEGYVRQSNTCKVDKFPDYNLVVTSLSAKLFNDEQLQVFQCSLSLGIQLRGILISPGVYEIILPIKNNRMFIAAAHVSEVQNVHSLRSNVDALREHIIALGRQCLGLPYIWGGRSIILGDRSGKYLVGADCSGFTELLFQVYGITIPRNAHDQYLKASPIQNGAQVQPGDLAFFTSRKNHSRMNHVTFYAGDGIILHLSGYGYCSIHEVPNPQDLVVREDSDVELLGRSIATFNNGDMLTEGLYAGSKVFFGSFLS